MSIWHLFGSMVGVRLTSAEPEQALVTANFSGIPVSHVSRVDELTYQFWIPRHSVDSLQKIVMAQGDQLTLLGKKGLYWHLCGIRKHPVLLLGLLALLWGTWFLPKRILFIQVEGNQGVPTRQILSAAEDCGICFGASRKDIRSERVKNNLLQQIPQLQWVGVNTAGCVATISVRERASVEVTEEVPSVSSIVAARDGFLLSGTVVSGNGLFQVGESVKRGQVLISGYTDSGFCIRATRARGEIVARTNRSICVVTPDNCLFRGQERHTKKNVSILFGKKRINLWKDSGISGATCDRIYEENYVTLPGGYTLPIALCVEVFTFAEVKRESISEDISRTLLPEAAQRYLLAQMVAGSIDSREEQMEAAEGVYQLKGNYVCTEMIGRERPEQIGETNGKND